MITTITHEFRVDDVLTDPDSIVLSDYDGEYGVKRTDNDAVVVAADTAMEKVSTGVYAYSFTDPAANLVYEYWIKFVINGSTLYTGAEINGYTQLNGYSLRDMIDELGMMLNELNQAGNEPFEYTPIMGVRLLNRAQNRVMKMLPRTFYTELHLLDEENALDDDGAFDLSTLDDSVFEKTVGLMGIRLNGDKFCRKITFAEYLELEQVDTTYSSDNPMYYIRGTNIHVLPGTSSDTVDLYYMREADTLALDPNNNSDDDVNCELPIEAQDVMLDIAASYGYKIGHDLQRSAESWAAAKAAVREIMERHEPSDSVPYSLFRDLSASPFTGGNPFDIYKGF